MYVNICFPIKKWSQGKPVAYDSSVFMVLKLFLKLQRGCLLQDNDMNRGINHVYLTCRWQRPHRSKYCQKRSCKHISKRQESV